MTLEIIGTLVGLAYLWFEYKASIYLWIAGIIMPAIYIFVYYNAGLYADFGINIYYLLIAVYGWCAWKFGGRKRSKNQASPETKGELPISHTPKGAIIPLVAIFFATFVLIVWVLKSYTDSTVPFCDSFTTALSIIGMWMLARKYLEQWFVWFVVDAVCVFLYIYKGLYFTAALYALYAIISIYGYRNWQKQMISQNEE